MKKQIEELDKIKEMLEEGEYEQQK